MPLAQFYAVNDKRFFIRAPCGDPQAVAHLLVQLAECWQQVWIVMSTSTRCRRLASLDSCQACLSQMGLQPTEGEAPATAHRAKWWQQATVWYLATWNFRSLLDVEGPVQTARQGQEWSMQKTEEPFLLQCIIHTHPILHTCRCESIALPYSTGGAAHLLARWAFGALRRSVSWTKNWKQLPNE